MPSYILIAQDPPAGGGDPPKKQQAVQGPLGDPMFMMMLMGLAFVFLIILPMRRQRREQAEMQTAIKRGAKVVTSGGIIGTIVHLKDNEDEITIRSEDAKIKVTKSSIARVLGHEESEPAKT